MVPLRNESFVCDERDRMSVDCGLAEQFGTPCYVYDAELIRKRNCRSKSISDDPFRAEGMLEHLYLKAYARNRE